MINSDNVLDPDEVWPDVDQGVQIIFQVGNRRLVLSIARNILTYGYPQHASLALFYVEDEHQEWQTPDDVGLPALAPLWADPRLARADGPIIHWVTRDQAIMAAQAAAAVYRPIEIKLFT